MTIFLYCILFAIGTLIGSFCTLAVYRIPLKKDITHEQSFCPNCNHKLAFWDLIPVLSYIFLRGKCRYCGKKIRIRYIILEIFAGIVVLLYGMTFDFKLTELEISKYIILLFGLLYITGLTIIAGIDKEKKQIQISVLIFNIIISFMYIIYLFVVGQANINRYAIYLFFMLTFTCIAICDKKTTRLRNIPVGFYIAIANILLVIIQNFAIFN